MSLSRERNVTWLQLLLLVKELEDFRWWLVDSADDGSAAVGKVLQRVHHTLRRKTVQSRSGLVGKQQWRVGQNLTREKVGREKQKNVTVQVRLGCRPSFTHP